MRIGGVVRGQHPTPDEKTLRVFKFLYFVKPVL